MRRFAGWVLGMALVAGLAPAAQAQNRVEMRAIATTNAASARPSCDMIARLHNVGTSTLSVFNAEVEASEMSTGQPLRLPLTSIPMAGIEPGATKDWTVMTVSGARCEQVRLRVTRVTCMRRCGSVTWQQEGLGALETPQ